MTPKKTGAKSSRSAPEETLDRKSLGAGEQPAEPATNATSTRSRKPWHKKSIAENILGQIDKLREEVAGKERDYQQARQQLDKLEQLRAVLENQ
jgi:hypothetical protein